MRTAFEIQQKIHDAMISAMHEYWNSNLTSAEREKYRLIMHGIEMAVTEKTNN